MAAYRKWIKPMPNTQSTDYPSRAQIWECATVVMEAQRICLSTVRYCLDKGGRASAAQFIRLLLDTAAVCQTTAECCRSGSNFITFSTGACRELCILTATSCGRFGEDAQLKTCAEVCQRAAECLKTLNSVLPKAA
jgi:hypothetical protein